MKKGGKGQEERWELFQVCGAEIEGVSFCEGFTYFLSSLLFLVT